MMVGPNYKEPKVNVVEHWLQAGRSPVVEKTAKNKSWWDAFADPTLTKLIHRGYNNNISLQIAGAKVLQTRAQLAQSVGELFPQQQAMMGEYAYERIGGSDLQTLLPPSFNLATLGFTASWELDFWGKFRRAIRANDAMFLASLAAYDNALVTLTSDIASAYINIRTQEELIRVTNANINVQTESLNIANARYRAGETSLLDVQQAKTELAQTKATLPTEKSKLQHYKDLLALLLGTVPTEVDKLLTRSKGIPKPSKIVEVGIPKETLSQRPDIFEARLEAIAQSELIGATKATLYPAVSLTGTFLFAATTIGNQKISDMFNWANRSILAGPGFNWPLLNYGQITNAVRAQDAMFQQSMLKYVNLVLQAQQEVQDNITQYVETQNSESELKKANDAAKLATKLAIVRYKEGEADYTTVIYVLRMQLQIQTSLTKAKGDVSQAMVAIYRALGGGWQIRGCNDVVPHNMKEQMVARTNWGNLLFTPNHLPPNSKLDKIKQLYLPNW